MKKFSGILILLVMALLATPLFAVNDFNELFNEVVSYDFLTETKIVIEEEVVRPYALSYEILAVPAVNSKQQVTDMYIVIGASADIGLEMEKNIPTVKDIYKTEFG